jgi:hypothetical protein
VYHPRTDGQSEIANKAIKQYLQHFTGYRQDDWAKLLPTAEFAYNNNSHTSTGVSPFKANYGFDPNFGGIPTADQCPPSVEQLLKQLAKVQRELKDCLELARETMKRQFDKSVRPTPDWQIGDKIWLSSKNISTTRPSPKLEHRWLGPFPVSAKISHSTYKLTLPDLVKGVHPVFHVLVLRKHQPDTIADRRTPMPDPVVVEGEEILDCRTSRRKKEYLVSWKGFGARGTHGNRKGTWTTAPSWSKNSTTNTRKRRAGTRGHGKRSEGGQAFSQWFFNAAPGKECQAKRGGFIDFFITGEAWALEGG